MTTYKRHYLKKGVAVVLVLLMVLSSLQGAVFYDSKAATSEVTGWLNVAGQNVEANKTYYLYEGETVTLGVNSGNSGDTVWESSDKEQAHVYWNGSAGASDPTKGTSCTVVGHTGGAEITMTATNQTLGYTQSVTFTVLVNDSFYFQRGGAGKIKTGQLEPSMKAYCYTTDLTIKGTVVLSTNKKNSISVTNATGHATYLIDNGIYTFKNENGQSTTLPSEPIVLSSETTVTAPDGGIHTIMIYLHLHVIDTLKLSEEETFSMQKGTENNPSTKELRASVTNTNYPVSWELYKGRVTRATATEDAKLFQDKDSPFLITTSSSDSSNAQLANVALLTITKDLNLSETREFTIFAYQTINGRQIEDIRYVTVTQPATALTLSNHEITVYLDGAKTSGATVTASVAGDETNGVDADQPDDITWFCTDQTVATISAESNYCTVVPQKPGHCVVVATSKTNPDASDTLYVEVVPKVSSVKITSTDMTVNLAEKELQLFANVQSDAVDDMIDTPDYDAYLNALDTTIHWSSSNESVATVDVYTGKVTLHSAGQVTITCTSATDAKIADSIVITVNVPVASIVLQDYFKKISVGESFTINYTLLSNYPGYEPSNKEVTWESSDNKVAMVDNDGRVTGVTGGTATILVRADDGQITATCTVEVYQAVSRIDISDSVMDLNIGEEAVLEAQVFPSTASEQTVTWSSNKPEVVSVTQDGVIKAEKVGDPVVITAYIVDRSATIQATCIVNVVVPLTSLSVSPASKTLSPGETLTLTKNVTPKDATNATVIYASTDPTVAKVSDSGVVTAVAGGHCYITVRSRNRDMMTSCYITVDEKVKKIKLNKKSRIMKRGSKYALSATITSATATNKEVSFSSSNKKVAIVNQKGVITAKNYGTAVITCSSMDGSGKKASCKVKVRRYISKLTLNHTQYAMKPKQKLTLTAKIRPANADQKALSYASSNKAVASVSKKGVVTAKRIGSCMIIVKSKDGSGKKARCRITVKKELTDKDITGNKIKK